MPSQNKSKLIRLTTMALLVSMSAVLSYYERFIPVINVPGVKLGLANIFTLTALVLLSWKEALLILLARVFLVSFFAGSPIGLLYGMSGGLMSLFAMYLALKFFPRYISIIGVSLVGAFFHNTGQCMVLGLLLGSWQIALGYYPILVLAALATGSLIGYITSYFLKHIQSIPLGPGLS